MRQSQLVCLFLLAGYASATVSPILEAVSGITALGSSLAGLAAAAVPSGLLLPLAMVASLKLPIIKLKLLKLKILAPVGVGIAGVAAAKTHFARSYQALVHAKDSLLDFPLKLSAVKMGAIAGGWAGGKAALGSYKTLPKPAIVYTSVPAVPLPEEPSYGRKPPAYGPPAPSYTPAPPAYVPAPETKYRRRRAVEETEDEAGEGIIRETFAFIQEMDKSHCVVRTVCEVAVQPEIAKGYGPEIIGFLNSLNGDVAAPWLPYKKALAIGTESQSRKVCNREYPTCQKNTEQLIEEGLSQIE